MNINGDDHMGCALKKLTLGIIGAGAAWMAAIRPRTKYGPDFSVLARYDFANGGLHDYYAGIPESSMPAFHAAMEKGYAIKLDVRLSKDGVPVVFPDDDLWRLCGEEGTVEETAWKDLKQMTLQETEEPVCSLEDVLYKIDSQVPVILNFISVKHNYGVLCANVIDILETYDGVFAVESADFRVIRWFREFEPEVLRGQVFKKQVYAGKDITGLLCSLARNLLLTNCIASPDYISVGLSCRNSFSLRCCRLLYHVPCVYSVISSDEDYETARRDDAVVVFEGIEPGD